MKRKLLISTLILGVTLCGINSKIKATEKGMNSNVVSDKKLDRKLTLKDRLLNSLIFLDKYKEKVKENEINQKIYDEINEKSEKIASGEITDNIEIEKLLMDIDSFTQKMGGRFYISYKFLNDFKNKLLAVRENEIFLDKDYEDLNEMFEWFLEEIDIAIEKGINYQVNPVFYDLFDVFKIKNTFEDKGYYNLLVDAEILLENKVEKPKEDENPVDNTEKPKEDENPVDNTEKPKKDENPVDNTEKPKEDENPVDNTEKPKKDENPVDNTEKSKKDENPVDNTEKPKKDENSVDNTEKPKEGEKKTENDTNKIVNNSNNNDKKVNNTEVKSLAKTGHGITSISVMGIISTVGMVFGVKRKNK